MALDCSKITTGFANESCGPTAIAGTAPRVILMSYSDIDKAASTFVAGTAPCADNRVLETIVLKDGAKAYEVDSLPNATVGEDTINVNTYNRTHQHNLTIRIFKKSEAAKCFVNQLTNARVVAIVENNDHGDDGDTKYEVYGWDSGLELNDLTVSTEMADGVAYLFTLGSGTLAQEGSLPISFFNTDEATTDTAIEALINPTPPEP